MRKKLKIAVCYSDIYKNYIIALTESGKNICIDVQPVWFSCGRAIGGARPFSELRACDFDGLLIPGGADIEPGLYGEKNIDGIDADIDTDLYQLAAADAFACAGKPILGICRGHQLLNIYFGGSLYQDISEYKNHLEMADGSDNAHFIQAEEGSILYNLYGRSFPVNSCHHQAVRKVGAGLRVTAKASDGIIEAMEHETLPVMSVQFHPERMDYNHRREDTVAGSLIVEEFLNIISRA